jgi:hypothetical protein
MDSYKLIEDTIKIDDVNRGGKVFERGKQLDTVTWRSV